MSRWFCGRADQHEAHALSGRDYCPGRPLADGEATPYGAADTWPEWEVTIAMFAARGEVSLAVDGDEHLRCPEYRAALSVRRLS